MYKAAQKLLWVVLVLVPQILFAAAAEKVKEEGAAAAGAGGPVVVAGAAAAGPQMLSKEDWLARFGAAVDFSMTLVQDNIIWIGSLQAYWANPENIARVNADVSKALPGYSVGQIAMITKTMLLGYEREGRYWQGLLRMLQILESRTARNELTHPYLVGMSLDYILEQMDNRGDQLKSIAYAKAHCSLGSNMFPCHLYPGNEENTQAQLESFDTIFKRLAGFTGPRDTPAYITKLRVVHAKIAAPAEDDLGGRSKVKGLLIIGGDRTGPVRLVERHKGAVVRSDIPDFTIPEKDLDAAVADIEGEAAVAAPLSKAEKKRRAKAAAAAAASAGGAGAGGASAAAVVVEEPEAAAAAVPAAAVAGGAGSSARRQPLGPIDAKLKEIILGSHFVTSPMPQRFTPKGLTEGLSDTGKEMLANLLRVNGARDYGDYKSVEKYTWDHLTSFLGELGFTRKGNHFIYADGIRNIGIHYLHKGNQLHHDMIDIMFGQLHAIGFTRPLLGTLLGLELEPWSWAIVDGR